MLACSRRARAGGRRIGFVPTMGALHEGHLSLVRAARRENDFVVVSIFVNPTQFGPREDLEKYPRMPDADQRLAAEAGADVTFEPSVEEMYPDGFATHVVQEHLGNVLEGASRPGHFRGVCTVCTKLFNIVQPDAAYFGQKDYQQSVVIRRLVRDLDLPIDVRVMPTVREPDGLAMSSRNRYLDPEQRRQAVCLSRALRLAQQMFQRGERDAALVATAARAEIEKEPLARIDYIALVHPDTLEPVARVAADTVALVAARIGATRLIDNAKLGAKCSTANDRLTC